MPETQGHTRRSLPPVESTGEEAPPSKDVLCRRVAELLGRQHVRGGADLELGCHGGTVEREEVELVAILRVLEDTPGADEFGIVVLLNKVRHGRTRILDLLVAVTERRKDNAAIGLEGIGTVGPNQDTSDACRVGA
jgi:hypothetical protein